MSVAWDSKTGGHTATVVIGATSRNFMVGGIIVLVRSSWAVSCARWSAWDSLVWGCGGCVADADRAAGVGLADRVAQVAQVVDAGAAGVAEGQSFGTVRTVRMGRR